MLKYVQVDSDGYAWLDIPATHRLDKLGYQLGRANDEWILYRRTGSWHELVYATTDHVLFDNYLKLLLED